MNISVPASASYNHVKLENKVLCPQTHCITRVIPAFSQN